MTEPIDIQTLKQLAIDIVEHRVFGTFSMEPFQLNQIHIIFVPLFFMNKDQIKDIENTAHFYEYLSEAGPRSINGMPIFYSVRMINKQDWEDVKKYIKKYRELKGDFIEGSPR